MKTVFSGKLSNGVAIEIVEADSFLGKSEFAVQVAGETASVSAVSILRSKDILVRTSAKAIRIKAGALKNPTPATPAPNLSDIKG